MYCKNKMLPASISTELVISILLVTITLFLTLGLFSNSVKNMITKGNFQNMFKSGDKTTYSVFNRDYTNAGVETLMTGEQGLEQIRREANNNANKLIENVISGVDESDKAINSIEYLALIIKSIVGDEGHVCIPMKKDSIAHCDEDGLEGYKYKVDLGNQTITSVSRTKPLTATSPRKEIKLTEYGLSNDLASMASTVNSNSDTVNTLSTSKKYDFITSASQLAKPSIYGSAMVMNTFNKFKSNDVMQNATTINSKAIFKEDLISLITSLNASIATAHSGCSKNGKNVPINSNRCCASSIKVLDECWVGNNESGNLISRFNEFISYINSTNDSNQKIMNKFLELVYPKSAWDRLWHFVPLQTIDNDHYNDPTSCDILQNGLNDLKSKYNLTGKSLRCKPSNSKSI